MFNIDEFIDACESIKINEWDYSIGNEGFFRDDKVAQRVVHDDHDLVDFVHIDRSDMGYSVPNQKWITGFWEKNPLVSKNLIKNLKYIETALDNLDAAMADYKGFAASLPSMNQADRDSKFDTWHNKYLTQVMALLNNISIFKGIPEEISKSDRARLEKMSKQFVDGFNAVIDELEEIKARFEQKSTLKKVFLQGKQLNMVGNNGFICMLRNIYMDLWKLISECTI